MDNLSRNTGLIITPQSLIEVHPNRRVPVRSVSMIACANVSLVFPVVYDQIPFLQSAHALRLEDRLVESIHGH